MSRPDKKVVELFLKGVGQMVLKAVTANLPPDMHQESIRLIGQLLVDTAKQIPELQKAMLAAGVIQPGEDNQ